MGMQVNEEFDARQYEPRQGGFGSLPVGKWPALIVETENVPTKDGSGGMFIVTFECEHGRGVKRYNVWNKSEQAKAIAKGELAALGIATGILTWSFANEGLALRNARCMIEVVPQSGAEAREKGYTEISRVLMSDGSEPKVPGQGAHQPAPAPPGPPQAGPGPGFANGAPYPQPTAQAPPPYAQQPAPPTPAAAGWSTAPIAPPANGGAPPYVQAPPAGAPNWARPAQ